MAVIKNKDLTQLSDWNEKELRKLKINLSNRIQTFDLSPKAKDLPKSNPLYGFGVEQCKSLLQNVYAAEKQLKKD